MYLKILRAVKRDLCQADEGEILVPNPIAVEKLDNDHFVGIVSRRPARFGRVVLDDDSVADLVALGDQTGVLDGLPPEELDQERLEEVRFFLDALSEFDVGDVVGCSFTFEGDEVTWDIFDVEDEEDPPRGG